MKIPALDYIESQGTRWLASELRYLLTLEAEHLKAEIQRLIGDSPVSEPAPQQEP